MSSKMEQEQIWRTWVAYLQRWRLGSFAAWLFDSISPIHLIGAQMAYIGQPFLEMFVPNQHFKALTVILEQPAQAQAFAALLREDS